MTVGKSGQPLAELSKTDLQALERDWIEALTQVSGTNPVSYTHLTLPTNREV